MEKCPRCRKQVDETLYSAHLIDRSKTEEMCTACRKEVEQGSLEAFAKKHIEALCDSVNGGDAATIGKALAEAMNYQHRYLQNEFFMVLANFFRFYRHHDFDARNEWAVHIAGLWDEQMGK
jgi:endogenous inhibitor of DNA gyrase (YacG/DUF329 family)